MFKRKEKSPFLVALSENNSQNEYMSMLLNGKECENLTALSENDSLEWICEHVVDWKTESVYTTTKKWFFEWMCGHIDGYEKKTDFMVVLPKETL